MVTMDNPASTTLSSSASSSSSSVQIHRQLVSPAPTSSNITTLRSSGSTMATTAKPAWLLSNLADVEERMKMFVNSSNINTTSIRTTQDEEVGDTFAERAEAYYKTRPQLLSLLEDLYNSYLTLSDRYMQTIAKNTSHSQTLHHSRGDSSQTSTIEYYDYHDQEDQDETSQPLNDSDVESSLSYHHQQLAHDDSDTTVGVFNFESLVADIVIKNVECDILLHEVNASERLYSESSRKIELQKSLLEVLESERLILLNENAQLGYRVGALVEENKTLASESLFMRRKAGELARYLLQMREDRRVSMLSRKIKDLQGQIYGLEKRNKEYYQQLLVKKDHHSKKGSVEEEQFSNMKKIKSRRGGNEVDLQVCFQMGKMNKSKRDSRNSACGDEKKKRSSWWGRVKNMDLFLCGLNPTTTV